MSNIHLTEVERLALLQLAQNPSLSFVELYLLTRAESSSQLRAALRKLEAVGMIDSARTDAGAAVQL